MKRLLAVVAGFAAFLITSGMCLGFLLSGTGSESPLCERGCDDLVDAPQWVGFLFQSGLVICLALTILLFLAERYHWSIRHETGEIGSGALIGGGIGCVGGVISLIIVIIVSLFIG